MPMLGSAALLLPRGSASSAVTQTVLKKTRGAAFRVGGGGTGLLRVPPALQSPRRRQDVDNHGYPSRQETCQCWRYVMMSRQKTCQRRRYATIRSPAAPTPSYSRPHGLAVTRRSSWWDHATSLTRMTLQTMRPLIRAIIR